MGILSASLKRELIRMERVRKKDYKGLKNVEDPATSPTLGMRMPYSQSNTLGVPPGIPATAWLGVERMKHLLDLKKPI